MAYIRLNITIPKETVEKLKKIAEKEKRSLSNMITYLIEKY
jgi:predicted CopG family antitoxin